MKLSAPAIAAVRQLEPAAVSELLRTLVSDAGSAAPTVLRVAENIFRTARAGIDPKGIERVSAPAVASLFERASKHFSQRKGYPAAFFFLVLAQLAEPVEPRLSALLSAADLADLQEEKAWLLRELL